LVATIRVNLPLILSARPFLITPDLAALSALRYTSTRFLAVLVFLNLPTANRSALLILALTTVLRPSDRNFLIAPTVVGMTAI